MPKYFVHIDDKGNVLGKSFSNIYTGNVIEHNDEWPHDENGDIAQKSKCKFDGLKLRLKTKEEIQAEIAAIPPTVEQRLSALEAAAKK